MKKQTPILSHPTLKLLQKCKTLKTLHQIHSHMLTTGLLLHSFPLSRLLLTSSSFSPSYSLSIFHHFPFPPTLFLFNTLFSSLSSHPHLSVSLYFHLLHYNIKPNSHTFPSLFKACGSGGSGLKWVPHGLALHGHVLKFLGFGYDSFVQAALVGFYSKCGKFRVSRVLFDLIREPDLVSWNCILGAYAQMGRVGFGDLVSCGSSMEVMVLFSEMQRRKVKVNEVSLVALISACGDLGALSQGLWAHAYVLKNDLELNCFVVTALIDMYAKCGCLGFAYQLFDEMPQRDILCYNTMIRGFAVHGYGDRALELFKKMRENGIVPDDVTFVVTICACSHIGLVEEGCRIFELMEDEYGMEPKVEHYGCLVDLLGRAGQLNEAEERIRTMPIKPNAIVWRSLLGAARVHGDLRIGEVALKNLIHLEPETSGNYVLLSNLYARNNKWSDVNHLRKTMKEKGVDKTPGSSLIEIEGTIHEFLIGDRTHPRSVEIYSKLEEINKRLYAYGHTPKTREVLFDIEEEEKEDALSYHSERLAIAFGLVASEPGIPMRIMKNLRVCSDCHVITKLISLIYDREIIVRDRNRFHHFRHGTCSCHDYW